MKNRVKIIFRITIGILVIILALSLYLISGYIDPNKGEFKNILLNIATGLLLSVIGALVLYFIDFLLDLNYKDQFVFNEYKNLHNKLGLVEINQNWSEIKNNSKAFKKLIKSFSDNSTWFITTMNPIAMVGDFLYQHLIPALKNGIKVYWIYNKFPDNENEIALKNFWYNQYRYSKNIENIDELLVYAKRDLKNNIDEVKRLIELNSNEINNNSFFLYESSIPTSFLGLLAIKTKNEYNIKESTFNSINIKKGFCLIKPYKMNPEIKMTSYGLLLKNKGILFNQYSQSIIDFYNIGITKNIISLKYTNDNKLS